MQCYISWKRGRTHTIGYRIQNKDGTKSWIYFGEPQEEFDNFDEKTGFVKFYDCPKHEVTKPIKIMRLKDVD